ncbi:sugar ABC transporter permease (plasmid) [Streptomyces poriferorum]|uniref:Sugar ABC transporter permease n=1 Tax=Streptomyces poriferorum TaxID=2798799 RepID=A0ABY9J164_9ACTN|nr:MULTISPECIES: sugar ABC transporter permease [unclassified Streptomyces]MDP5309364.1 sugar ABC transporter permease [Streptomyces sp. Alt4]WLQ53816.1 sugar ABC transporter permease [Streptomyces sp. Alt1]WLQ61433.1 sugar ABC transporter permease [Streptomyces sp. Alt2]WRZ03168.1 sugar ABC transporter permease [Streptomyces sp. NBC_00385]
MKTTRHPRPTGYAVFLAPGLLLSLLFLVVPLVMTFYYSLTQWQGIGDPTWIGFDNYTRLFSDSDFWASFRNIAFVIVGIAVVPTLLGLFLAALLFDYIGKKHGDGVVSLFRSGLYLPQVIPVAVTGLMWGWILAPEGAVNSVLEKAGLASLAENWLGDPDLALWVVLAVLVWMQLGYPLVLFLSGLQRIDPELYEAASLDGATWWQRFTRITVPILRPEVYVVLVTTTIAGLKVFAQIFVLTGGGPGNSTLVPSYFAYQNFFERADVGYGSAISSTITLLVLIIAGTMLTRQAREDG